MFIIGDYIALGWGGYLIFDGVYSIYRYWNAPVDPNNDPTHERKQGWQDHSIRVIRAIGGVFCILIGLGIIHV